LHLDFGKDFNNIATQLRNPNTHRDFRKVKRKPVCHQEGGCYDFSKNYEQSGGTGSSSEEKKEWREVEHFTKSEYSYSEDSSLDLDSVADLQGSLKGSLKGPTKPMGV
jgi:hypothetical protein